MEIEFDANKSAENVVSRGLTFALVDGFDWDTALVVEDTRFDYPERRFQALGRIDGRLHMVVFTPVALGRVRVISFRKANAREVRRYEAQAT